MQGVSLSVSLKFRLPSKGNLKRNQYHLSGLHFFLQITLLVRKLMLEIYSVFFLQNCCKGSSTNDVSLFFRFVNPLPPPFVID